MLFVPLTRKKQGLTCIGIKMYSVVRPIIKKKKEKITKNKLQENKNKNKMNDYKHFKYRVIMKLNVKEKEANKNCFSQNKKLQIFHL
jgi:hypothetical protein